jgi:hypothetical protein
MVAEKLLRWYASYPMLLVYINKDARLYLAVNLQSA